MKISKIKIISFLSLIILISIFFHSFNKKPVLNPVENKIEKNSLVENTQSTTNVNKKIVDKVEVDKNTIPATFTTPTKSYKVMVPENTSMYDLMKILQSTQGLKFTSKVYPSLGVFIESIDDVKADGKFWIYYVNGVEGSVGASNYIIRPNDEIVWKLEKSL